MDVISLVGVRVIVSVLFCEMLASQSKFTVTFSNGLIRVLAEKLSPWVLLAGS